MASFTRTISRALRNTELGWRYAFNLAPALGYWRDRRPLAGEGGRVLGDLNRDGIAITSANALLGPVSLFDEVDGTVMRMEEERAAELDELRRAASDTSSLASKAYLCELLGTTPPLETGSVFARFALQDPILDVANAYFGMYTRMRQYNVWHNFVNQAPPRQSQLWHRDREDRQILKVFVYLKDVDDGAGPFTYAPGTHVKGPIQKLPESFREHGVPRSTDEQMEKVVPRERWIKGTAPRGAIVFADTHGYHKGGEARTQDRLMYMCMFTSPASESKELMARPAGPLLMPDVARAVALSPPRRRFWVTLPATRV